MKLSPAPKYWLKLKAAKIVGVVLTKELTTIIDCAEITHAICDHDLADEMRLVKSEHLQKITYFRNSDLDSKIVKKLDKFTKDGIYAKAIKTSESKYAIVWVYNTDKSNLKDEIKKSLTSISNFSTKCETSYLRKYNFDVYEPSIKKKIKKSSKDYFE